MDQLHIAKSFLILLLLTSCIWISAGCGYESRESPTVADSTLIPVLTELHLARARQEIQQDLPPSARDSILARYGVDSASLARTLSYYADHPGEYHRLYKQVTFQLQERRRDTTGQARVDSVAD